MNFYFSDPGCILNYCDLSYGGSSLGIIYMESSSNNVSISNSTIRYSAEHGLYFSNSLPQISNCKISENISSGFFLTNSSPVISSCDISDNNSYGIYCNNNNCDLQVTNSIIQNNGRRN